LQKINDCDAFAGNNSRGDRSKAFGRAILQDKDIMMKLSSQRLILGLVVLGAASWMLYIKNSPAYAASGATKSDGQELTCRLVPQIQQLYTKRHVLFGEMSAELESRSTDQFIKRLDGSKMYFLESDVDDIKKTMKSHFVKLAANKCSILDDAYKKFIVRAEERAAFAKSRLDSDKWAVDPKTEIQLDPDKRKYPKTKAEAEAFQDKYLQFQISNYLATEMKLDEAKKKVLKGYERTLKQIKDRASDEILADYLDSYARAMDPHSAYNGREGKEEFEIDMRLSLEGIGASLSWDDGFTIVEELIVGGSAKKDGRILPKDKIIAVGQVSALAKETDEEVKVEMENVTEMPLKEVVRKIRGPKGTKVRLKILRKKTDGTIENFLITLMRDQVKLADKAAAVQYIERVVGGSKKLVAVVNLPTFYADSEPGGRSSASDMKAVVKEAKDKGAEAMVLDFSSNGGGSLEDAVRIAGLFFRTGAVVRQSSRDVEENDQLEDRDPTVDWDGPLVLLISRISASASEIVAGTLKDYKRAVVVGGDHTFGKGTVQQVLPLSKFGMVKVTVGMFFTPGGFSTQHRGVESDIPFPDRWASEEMGEKHLDYSLPPKKLKSFLSDQAFVASGPGAWKKIDAGILKQLKSRSGERVAKNTEFKKIKADLEKAKKRGKIAKLSDSLKDVKEKKEEIDQKKNLSKEEKDSDYLKRADIQEASNVAIDLWAAQKGLGFSEVDKAIRLSQDQLESAVKLAKEAKKNEPKNTQTPKAGLEKPESKNGENVLGTITDKDPKKKSESSPADSSKAPSAN
jgi:carboxyl-terminal processing protease